MEKYKVNQVQSEYTDFQKEKVMTVTEWSNLEGVDVNIAVGLAFTHFSLTYGDWLMLKKSMKMLDE